MLRASYRLRKASHQDTASRIVRAVNNGKVGGQGPAYTSFPSGTFVAGLGYGLRHGLALLDGATRGSSGGGVAA